MGLGNRRSRSATVAVIAVLLGAVGAGAASGKEGGGSAEATASAAHTRIVTHSTRRDAGIFAFAPQGGGERRLRKGLVDGVSVSANGRRMAFAATRSTPCSRCTADIFVDVYVADGEGRHARRIKRFKHAALESLAISPDGRRLVLVIYRGSAGADIYAIRADGSGVRRLTRGGRDESGVAFSPDGRRIAFSREGGGGSAIFSMRSRGGGLHRVSQGNGYDTDPAYSPDGRLIAFSRADNSVLRLRSLYLMRTDGTSRRRLTSHPAGLEDLQPDFSPNGRALAFARGTGVDFDVFTVRISGGAAQEAADAPVGLIDPNWTRRP
jgi:Tol biopolymer transport system component